MRLVVCSVSPLLGQQSLDGKMETRMIWKMVTEDETRHLPAAEQLFAYADVPSFTLPDYKSALTQMFSFCRSQVLAVIEPQTLGDRLQIQVRTRLPETPHTMSTLPKHQVQIEDDRALT
jgi:hypothetical protein